MITAETHRLAVWLAGLSSGVGTVSLAQTVNVLKARDGYIHSLGQELLLTTFGGDAYIQQLVSGG